MIYFIKIYSIILISALCLFLTRCKEVEYFKRPIEAVHRCSYYDKSDVKIDIDNLKVGDSVDDYKCLFYNRDYTWGSNNIATYAFRYYNKRGVLKYLVYVYVKNNKVFYIITAERAK